MVKIFVIGIINIINYDETKDFLAITTQKYIHKPKPNIRYNIKEFQRIKLLMKYISQII